MYTMKSCKFFFLTNNPLLAVSCSNFLFKKLQRTTLGIYFSFLVLSHTDKTKLDLH